MPAPPSGQREGEAGVNQGGIGSISFPSSASTAWFPLSRLFFFSLPLCGCAGGFFPLWVTRTAQSSPRNVAEPRGCRTWLGQQDAVASSSHKQPELLC